MAHTGAHNFVLVALSILIAIGASFSALDLAARLKDATGWARHAWLATAAIAMGGGIWAMHFVAMLAFSLPGVEIGYDLPLTLFSLLLPIAVTALGFRLMTRKHPQRSTVLASGLVMGLGIAAMHYLGMAAMKMPVDLSHHHFWVALSIVIAIVAATAALWLSVQKTRLLERALAAIAMGLAIAGMHYAAMRGAMFSDLPVVAPLHDHTSISQTSLAVAVFIATFFILALALSAAMFDRHVTAKARREALRLRDSEQHFKLLVQGVTDYAIFMLNPKGIITNWNAGAERIKGYSAEEIIGSHLSRFYTEEDQYAGLPDKAVTAAASLGKFEAEGWRVRKDGSRFWASVVLNALHDENGQLIGFAKITRDISERREAQEALERTRLALYQAQKMEAVGQLTGGLAHDFNNLLTGIMGSLELLQSRVAQGRFTEIDRYVNAAQDSARRAAALTHRLLAFSRRQTFAPKPTNITALVAGMEELIRRTIGPEINLAVADAENLWPVLVDPPQLESALLNLCINARDAMPGGGSITISAANKSFNTKLAAEHGLPSGDFICLAVMDTGTGMPPDVIANAFDPFFTTKPIGQGTGLGLSMIYGFIQQSGGQVRIESEMGQGTTVSLYLPRHLGEAAHEEETKTLSKSGLEREDTIVMIVDDEANLRMLVSEVLRELGYKTFEAEDGPSAHRLLQKLGQIDLLITDVGLPGGMNGRQLADAARQLQPELKVLFITGYAESSILSDTCLTPGMQVLTKPFSLDVLTARVRDFSDESRSAESIEP